MLYLKVASSVGFIEKCNKTLFFIESHRWCYFSISHSFSSYFQTNLLLHTRPLVTCMTPRCFPGETLDPLCNFTPRGSRPLFFQVCCPPLVVEIPTMATSRQQRTFRVSSCRRTKRTKMKNPCSPQSTSNRSWIGIPANPSAPWNIPKNQDTPNIT